MLLLGPPGSGKSAFCKALGAETGRPTLILDVGALLGSLVGQSEANIRQALRLVDAMSPCVVMIDEVEKALAGVARVAQADSGVSARMFGTLLSWLNDHESDAFVVCTANDVSKLPPEFARAERFDGTFFLDLPGPAEKEAIWRMYLERFGLDPDQRRPRDRDWTRRRDQGVLPAGGAARRPAGRGGAEHRPGGRDGGRVGRAAAAAGPPAAACRPTAPASTPAATDIVDKPGRNVRRDPSAN